MLKDKLELEREIEMAESKVTNLENQISGVQDPQPLNNAKILEELEDEFKSSERYTDQQLRDLYKKPF